MIGDNSKVAGLSSTFVSSNSIILSRFLVTVHCTLKVEFVNDLLLYIG